MPSYTQYMRQMAVMDASDDDIESWITVKGNHIPIKKGQSKEDAVKEFISKKSDKEFSKRAEKPQSIGEATKKVVSQVKENREINKASKKDPWEKKANTGYGEALRRGKNSKKISESEAEEYRQYQQSPEFATKTFEQYKAAKKEYPPEFETVRKNAKANPNLYGGKYTQKSKADAYKEYKADTEKKEEKPADLEKRASAIGLKPGAKVQFADGTIKEVVGVRSDLVDLKNDGKVGAHTLYPLEKGIKNGEIKVLNGNESKGSKEKAYNTEGLYQDALNELDDQIADKQKELENIHLAMTQNIESGYFDIANSNMMDIEFVEGQLKELKKKREKLAGVGKTTAEKAGINWEKFEDLEQGSSVSQEITQMANRDDYDMTRALLDRMRHDNDYWLGAGAHANNTLWAKNPKDQIAKMRELLKSLPDKEKPKWLTEKDIDNYEQKMLGKK